MGKNTLRNSTDFDPHFLDGLIRMINQGESVHPWGWKYGGTSYSPKQVITHLENRTDVGLHFYNSYVVEKYFEALPKMSFFSVPDPDLESLNLRQISKLARVEKEVVRRGLFNPPDKVYWATLFSQISSQKSTEGFLN